MVCVLSACGGDDGQPTQPPLDAGAGAIVDAPIVVITSDACPTVTLVNDSLAVPVGGACGSPDSGFCDGTNAWCLDLVCRPFCDPVNYPRCQTGSAEHHSRLGCADLCVCVPE